MVRNRTKLSLTIRKPQAGYGVSPYRQISVRRYYLYNIKQHLYPSYHFTLFL